VVSTVTLILSYANWEYVVQVSDRRLTYRNGKLYNDRRNKAVVFCNQMTFAYTGLGYIGRRRTDDWLADVLGPHKFLDAAVNSVKVEAGKSIARFYYRPSNYRYLEFVGVGWARYRDVVQPVLAIVSNYRDLSSNILSTPQRHFVYIYSVLGELPYVCQSSGQPLTRKEAVVLNRYLRKGFEKRVSAPMIARVLAGFIRTVAGRNRHLPWHGRMGYTARVQAVYRAILFLFPRRPLRSRSICTYYGLRWPYRFWRGTPL
jgi:hypothetical protein